MTGFSVSPDSLDELARRIGDVAGRLDQIHDGRDQARDAVCSGNQVGPWGWEPFHQAADRLDNFLGHWSNGIAKIGKNTSKVSELLTKAAAEYRKTEASLTNATTPKP